MEGESNTLLCQRNWLLPVNIGGGDEGGIQPSPNSHGIMGVQGEVEWLPHQPSKSSVERANGQVPFVEQENQPIRI